MEPGTPPKSSTGLALTLVLGLLTAACQSATPGEEAKQISAAAEAPVPPRPRPGTDIIGLLDQRQLSDVESALRRLAEEPPPGARLEALADFYLERGLAAGRLGRAKQAIDDLTKSSEYFLQTVSPVHWSNFELALAEERGGNFFTTSEIFEGWLTLSVDTSSPTPPMSQAAGGYGAALSYRSRTLRSVIDQRPRPA